jgi:hypothetical protein
MRWPGCHEMLARILVLANMITGGMVNRMGVE